MGLEVIALSEGTRGNRDPRAPLTCGIKAESKKRTRKTRTDDRRVVTRGRGEEGGGGGEGVTPMGTEGVSLWVVTTQRHTHDMLLNCTLETYTVLLPNIVPINNKKMSGPKPRAAAHREVTDTGGACGRRAARPE